MEEIATFLRSPEGLKLLEEILRDKLSVKLTVERESDYGSSYNVIEVTTSFNGEQICRYSGQIYEKD